MRRVTAIVPHALGQAPGQRVRIETWATHLAALGWSVDLLPFESRELREVIYRPGHTALKASRLVRCFLAQLGRLLRRDSADVLILYREASLIGPALLERLAARLGPPLVYDIDDPVFLRYRSPANRWLSLLKFSRKTDSLFRLADHVVCVNQRIAGYARKFNPQVSVIPNCIDTEAVRPSKDVVEPPVCLAWIGSHSAVPNLSAIAGPLRRLQERCDVRLRLIGPDSEAPFGLKAEVRAWSAETEVAALHGCHIGVVPLVAHPWNEWKFFYKTIQYMAVGLPVVAANEGSNQEIIEPGVNGYLARSEDEWYDSLARLCGDADLRRRMGLAARSTIVDRFSLRAHMPRVASILEAALKGGRKRAG